jgi:hypothetical protein
MLPANIEDPQFAPGPEEPVAARLAQDAIDHADDVLEDHPWILEGLFEVGMNLFETFINSLAPH